MATEDAEVTPDVFFQDVSECTYTECYWFVHEYVTVSAKYFFELPSPPMVFTRNCKVMGPIVNGNKASLTNLGVRMEN